jgi:hypothetical protein
MARAHLEGTDPERMGDGDDGAFRPPTGGQARVRGPHAGPSLLPSACGPVGSGGTRQAITVFLGTSNPAPCVKITSREHPLWLGGWQETPLSRLDRACAPPRREVATSLGADR